MKSESKVSKGLERISVREDSVGCNLPLVALKYLTDRAWSLLRIVCGRQHAASTTAPKPAEQSDDAQAWAATVRIILYIVHAENIPVTLKLADAAERLSKLDTDRLLELATVLHRTPQEVESCILTLRALGRSRSNPPQTLRAFEAEELRTI